MTRDRRRVAGYPWRWLAVSAAHFLATVAIAGLIFLVSHVPPRAINLDSVLSVLAGVEWVLVAPRKGVLAAWPTETTPALLPPIATLLNSLGWGGLLLWMRREWRRLTR